MTLDATGWNGPWPEQACDSLEQGAVLHFTGLRFPLAAEEARLAAGGLAAWKGKNIGWDARTGRFGGMAPDDSRRGTVRDMILRFAQEARTLVLGVAPRYGAALRTGRASYRPEEIAGRAYRDWRSDDTRLHTDAFAATPLGGDRILRVFANMDPDGRPRVWRVGESLESLAARYLPRIRPPRPASALLLRATGRTEAWRSPYDHYMLRLHDLAKADDLYQARSPQRELAFGPSVWMVFSDQVAHAAMAGRNALECTFHLPPSAQRHPELSPLRVLERLTGRKLSAT